MPRPTIRLLALDVDGTLLDPLGKIRPRVLDAIRRLDRAGIRPILCTGRRFRRARPIAEELGIAWPIVCNSGAILKAFDGETLWRADWPADLADAVTGFFRDRAEPMVSFQDRDADGADFLATSMSTGCPFFDDYVAKNERFAEARGDLDRLAGSIPFFHACAIGDRPRMERFEAEILDRMAGRIQTFVQHTSGYLGTMCEVLRADASKWAAIVHLAERWGIDPSAICAVGDDRNDVPMLRGAGLGVAMGNALPEIRAEADRTVAGNDLDGVAQLVDELLESSGTPAG